MKPKIKEVFDYLETIWLAFSFVYDFQMMKQLHHLPPHYALTPMIHNLSLNAVHDADLFYCE
jgi:hypothetical protein